MKVSDYVDLYRSEAADILQALERGIIALESAPEIQARIEELYRHAHNLKGISGAMGYEEVVEASHEFENVLDGFRSASSISGETMDKLLAMVDGLKILVKRTIDGSSSSNSDIKAGSQDRAMESSNEQAAQPIDEHITATKVELERLDRIMDLVGELVASRMRVGAIAEDLGSRALLDELARSWRIVSQIQKEVMEARLVPAGQVFQRFHRLVRDLSKEMGKPARLKIEGAEIGLDRAVLERMVDPLVHLIRNAMDHGIEEPDERATAGKPPEARILLGIRRERSRVIIEVSDDGKGIDVQSVANAALARGLTSARACDLSEEDICRIITAPGFSTSKGVDKISGRGVGMNIVKSVVDSFGGSIRLSTKQGRGTTVSLLLPINLSIVKALLFTLGEEYHAIPAEYVKETNRYEWAALKTVRGNPVLEMADELVPLIFPEQLFGAKSESNVDRYAKVIVMDTGTRRLAIAVNRIIGQQDIVIKSLPPFFRGLRGISGAAVLGSGKIAFIWDPHAFSQGRCKYESDQETVVSAS